MAGDTPIFPKNIGSFSRPPPIRIELRRNLTCQIVQACETSRGGNDGVAVRFRVLLYAPFYANRLIICNHSITLLA